MAMPETNYQKMFSIIIATHNCGQKIENTLQSIFAQPEHLFELIVIDNLSTDDTLSYLKKYEHRLTLVSESDNGVYYAFNKAMDLACGKYFYFIGAGDCLRPNVLEQIKEFLPDQTPALVYGNYFLMQQKIYRGSEFNVFQFVGGNICHQAIFYHRTVFDIVGKYDLQYKIFSDWVFNFKCFTNPQISKRYVPCVIADFEEGGLSARLDNDPMFKKEFPKLIKKELGTRLYLICKAFMLNPNLVFSSYGAGHAVRGRLISFGQPYVRGYKLLRKSLSKKSLSK